jgi:hypothetical protein
MKTVYSLVLTCAAFMVLTVLSSCTQQPGTALVTSTVTATSTATRTSVAVTKPAVIEAACPARGAAQAVDLSMPVDQKALNTYRHLYGDDVTIIRYYDHVNETIRGKTPQATERALLAANGVNCLRVFQHNNSSLRTFQDAARPGADAKRSVELAAVEKQPKGSAIYFGVDGEFHLPSDQTAVKSYAAKFCAIVHDAGFKCGVYGAGITLKNLLAAGIVDYTWLANATGWTGSKDFQATGKWNLRQGLPKVCGGKEGDFDVVNPAIKNFGQWKCAQ